jgi:hypothetical protein
MSNIKNTLDFYVIGAKKAGTTSLYYYFSKMPELCIHDCKELSFLTPGFQESGTFDRVVATQYSKADPKKLWGGVTPHYLYDNLIPEKLRRFMPAGRFIVILRDPVDRAVSNFRMMLMQGHESRDINEVMRFQLDPRYLEKQRRSEFYHGADVDSYIAWGEYGRLLEKFLSVNSRESLLVCFLEELSAKPYDEFEKICRFIGVAQCALPENLGVKYNNLRDQRTLLPRWFASLRDNDVLRRLGRTLVPEKTRREIVYRYSLQKGRNVQPTFLSKETECQLVAHFEPDVRRLETLIGRSVPWPRFVSD